MRAAVIGASGFLGGAIFRTLLAADVDAVGTGCSRVSHELAQLDATNYDSVANYIYKTNPDIVILAAGTKDILKCEQQWALAETVNVEPVRNIVSFLTENQPTTRLVLISTDYVFEGTEGNYMDCSATNPQTNYGRSKLMAEEVALSSTLSTKVVRTAAVMGRGARLFDWILGEFEANSKIEMYSNIRFSPTPLGLFNQCMLNLISEFDNVNENIIHLVGPEGMSRYELAVLIRDIAGKQTEIVPIKAGGLFQEDLSLIPSGLTTKWTTRSLAGYLQDEL